MAASDMLQPQQFYHYGTDPSSRSNDSYIHVGTLDAAQGRKGQERSMYKVTVQPQRPMNSPHNPLDDSTANMVGMVDEQWRASGRQPTARDFDPDFISAPRAARDSGWTKSHDALYYLNSCEGDKPSVSAMVRPSAIKHVEKM